MTRKYNLESSMTDRAEFDRVQEQYAEAMLEALTEAEALIQDPGQYAEIGWENFEIDLEAGAVEVDDLKEAKSRFMDVFKRAVTDWQHQRLIDNYEDVDHERGSQTTLTVAEGGELDNGIWIEIIHLDDYTVAYRRCDDSIDQDWQLGAFEDAVNLVFEERHQLKQAQAELAI